ncbi:hypothetical protein YTPLAS18_28750 [Nitrospira sp.]|nr:hypothetical protein YTPLAS18_28750 [Nitrospira sp.]
MSPSSGKKLTRGAKWALAAAGCMVLYAVIGFLVVPRIVHSKLETVLTEQLGHPVSVKEVSFNPLALSLTLREFDVHEEDRSPILGFEELYINVELASVVNRALTLSMIRVTHPYVLAVVRSDGALNLMDLRPSTPQTESTDPPASGDSQDAAPLGVIVEHLLVDRGILEFHDESKPTPFSTEIVPLTFALQNFTTQPKTLEDHELNFTAEIGPGEGIEWRGSLYFQPIRSEGTIKLTGIRTRTLWEYIKDLVNFEITDGIISLTIPYEFRSDPDAFHATIQGAAFMLTQFALAEKGQSDPILSVPGFAISGIDVDLGARQARIAAVHSRDARIKGWLNKDGSTNFQTLFAGGTATPPVAKEEPRPESPSEPTPWDVTLDRIEIENYGIAIEDRTPSEPVRLALNPLVITVTDVTSRLDSKIGLDVSVRVNDAGTIKVTGGVTGKPLAADLDIDVSNIAFVPFQPYLDSIAQLQLKSGAANLKGHLAYRAKDEQKPHLQYAGKISITKLLTQDTLLHKDFLKWDELAFNRVNLDLEPTRITIAEIVAKKPYLRFIIGPDRSTNVQEIFAKQSDPSPTSAEAKQPTDQAKGSSKPAPPIQIGAIRLVDASTHFADFSLKPVIDTGIFGLNGAIKGLSSKELSRADVSLQGKVDKYAPVAIKGKINPLTSDAFTDIALAFKNVELTTVSPYATKFAGYPIKKGKVSVDLQYKLSKHILEAENKVVIEQLTLGDQVESPDATSLPVKLAIALLKDRHGVIDIDLPVRGDLNDPDFKYGRALLGVLVNLVTKAVTAPFNLIAGLVGGDSEELGVVEFPVGGVTLTPSDQEKLSSLAKALKERPGLQLEVAGAADAEADRAALAELKLHRELLAASTKPTKSEGTLAPEMVDFGTLPHEKQTELVEALYRKKYGQLPKPLQGKEDQPASRSIDTLKERLLGDITIDDSEIVRLGRERAKHIQDYLVAEGGIAPERIFLLDVKLDAKSMGGTVSTKLNLDAA